jgi:anaerobic magnesium-protoporphyrin IX monomethyl ester cyclase
MKILLLNPPHPSIGSRIPDEHLPPLGLLAIGGPLIDDRHQVELLDAEFGPLTVAAIVHEVCRRRPDAVFIGHSGSTSAHPGVVKITRAIRHAWPSAWIVYGGVFPTFHWREIMTAEPQIDVIVRGEGEVTAARLMHAFEAGEPLEQVAGIAFREWTSGTGPLTERRGPGLGGPVRSTRSATVIAHLDEHRVGWELIDFARYTYWGGRRAVVVQFSRGCPHRCSYCGQRDFWRRWRHRDPERFAHELAWLHREHGVKVINFADEDPTASRSAWRTFLEALVRERVSLILVGSTRADDIVRDSDLLPLYKRAGVARFLLGMESTDDATLSRIRKGSCRETDREAIRLLRRHGILSMAAYVPGFQEAGHRDYWRALRQILAYDPDQIQLMYATPHRWTTYYRELRNQRVVQTDLSRWDYKHQVMANGRLSPWQTIAWMKLIEVAAQMRPASIRRVLAHPDRGLRAAMRWYYRIGRKVWLYEWWQFLFCDRRPAQGPSLREFMGEAQPATASGADFTVETNDRIELTPRLNNRNPTLYVSLINQGSM